MAQVRRKGSYPIQSPEYLPHPISEEGPSERPPQALPRAIRALRNSEVADCHERTLVICLDGTGDQFDHDNSNVVHFVSCLLKHNPAQQVTYYQSGIGTYDQGGLKAGIGAGLDMAVGSGLGIHIKDAYKFLMQNYHDGDKICLLGFSRGAYTVRCLAGMLHKVGLLPAGNGAQLNFAYKFYKDNSPEGWTMSAEFKKTFCTDINVYFLGLWDCVASVGFIPRKLPFSKSPTNSVRYFRHAMALDEHRSKFKICQWQHENPQLKRAETFDATPMAQMKRGLLRTGDLFRIRGRGKDGAAAERNGIAAYKKELWSNGVTTNGVSPNEVHRHASTCSAVSENEKDIQQHRLEAEFERLDANRRKNEGKDGCETDALEVWFMGAHADVGGGAVKNEKRHKLAQVPLRWMIRQCFACDTGILFSTEALAELGLDVYALWPTYQAPSQPITGPPPSIQAQYERAALPALRHRSALIRLQRESRAKDEQTPPRPGPDQAQGNGHMKPHYPTENTDADDADSEASLLLSRHQSSSLLFLLPESTEDYFDARAPVNDQLVQARGWWILEFWPVEIRVLAKCGEGWEKRVAMNLGRYRAVREQDPNMHWSVWSMMEEGRYKLRVRQDGRTHWNVVA